MGNRPSRRDLTLACEALAALVYEEFPKRALSDLLQTYAPEGLEPRHYTALVAVEPTLLTVTEAAEG